MNIFYYILYTTLLIINNFLIFHFIVLKPYGPKSYKTSWAEAEMEGLYTGQSLEIKKNNEFKRIKRTWFFEFNTLSFYVKNYNKKLNNKYGMESKINRWKRITPFWSVWSITLILLFSIAAIAICYFTISNDSKSILWLFFVLISVALIWVFTLVLFIALVMIVFLIVSIVLFVLRAKNPSRIKEKLSFKLKMKMIISKIWRDVPASFMPQSKSDNKTQRIVTPFWFTNIFCVSYRIKIFYIISVLYLIAIPLTLSIKGVLN